MKVPLHFGEEVIELEISENNLSGFYQPAKLTEAAGKDALANAINRGFVGLPNRIAERSVGVLLPDGTRDFPLDDVLPLLLQLLQNAKKIHFFICTGSHDPETESNSKIVVAIHKKAVAAGIFGYEITLHDCQNALFSSAGVTRQGTQVQYNARLDEVDVFIALSDVKHHYFAGYSNPIKNIAPGLCDFETIQRNHSLTFDPRSQAGIHPWHSEKNRRDNPLAIDQLEAMERIVRERPFWAITTISREGVIQWIDCGPAETVTAKAFQWADAYNAHTVKPARYMVVSPGGLPNDVDLYIAQRALELTSTVIADGGRILFLAACPDGIGSRLTKENFENRLSEPLETILRKTPNEYHLFEHKPYRFAKLIRRLAGLWLYTKMPDSMIQQIHMRPCGDPQAIVDAWIKNDPDASILVVDGANKLFLRI
ncbi:MAG: lactate racemase domain-containing protein [Planctomycetota bacterium]|jgi:nickel-dependent lactate racemase